MARMGQQDEGQAPRMQEALTRQGETFLQGEVRRAREAVLRGRSERSAARTNAEVQDSEAIAARPAGKRVDWLTE